MEIKSLDLKKTSIDLRMKEKLVVTLPNGFTIEIHQYDEQYGLASVNIKKYGEGLDKEYAHYHSVDLQNKGIDSMYTIVDEGSPAHIETERDGGMHRTTIETGKYKTATRYSIRTYDNSYEETIEETI